MPADAIKRAVERRAGGGRRLTRSPARPAPAPRARERHQGPRARLERIRSTDGITRTVTEVVLSTLFGAAEAARGRLGPAAVVAALLVSTTSVVPRRARRRPRSTRPTRPPASKASASAGWRVPVRGRLDQVVLGLLEALRFALAGLLERAIGLVALVVVVDVVVGPPPADAGRLGSGGARLFLGSGSSSGGTRSSVIMLPSYPDRSRRCAPRTAAHDPRPALRLHAELLRHAGRALVGCRAIRLMRWSAPSSAPRPVDAGAARLAREAAPPARAVDRPAQLERRASPAAQQSGAADQPAPLSRSSSAHVAVAVEHPVTDQHAISRQASSRPRPSRRRAERVTSASARIAAQLRRGPRRRQPRMSQPLRLAARRDDHFGLALLRERLAAARRSGRRAARRPNQLSRAPSSVRTAPEK